MTRLLGLVLAASMATATTFAQFRASTSAVAVHVSVSDGRQPVTGLRADEFLLTDSGVPQRVAAVSAAETPVDLTLVVPNPETMTSGKDLFAREIAEVTGLLSSDDRLRVIGVGTDVIELTSGRKAAAEVAVPIRSRCGATFDALASLFIQPGVDGRQHVVMTMSRSEGTGNATTAAALTDLARRTSARMYVLMDRGDGSMDDALSRLAPWCAPAVYEWDAPRQRELTRIAGLQDIDDRQRALWEYQRQRLLEIAELTGGDEISRGLVGRSIAAGARRVLEIARSGYILYYTPTGVPAAGWHPIEVTVTRPGTFEIHARPGYTR